MSQNPQIPQIVVWKQCRVPEMGDGEREGWGGCTSFQSNIFKEGAPGALADALDHLRKEMYLAPTPLPEDVLNMDMEALAGK